MNLLKNIFKRRQINYQRENYKVVKTKLADRQERVYKAVELINTPSTGRQIARFLNMDSASVTPRLAELVRKGRVAVAYRKRSLDDGVWRKYYTVVKS